MSRSRRTVKKAGSTPGGPPTVSKVRGPADVAIMVPYLLGFQPVESLVVVALEGPRRRFGPVLRVDLADERMREPVANRVVDVLCANLVRRVLVAAYSDDPQLADPVVRLVIGGFARRGIEVEDAFRADGRRWWSYTCRNRSCCSPDGMPYDARASRVAAEAVVAGLTFAPDREAVRSELEPDRPEIRAEVARLVERRKDPGPQVTTAIGLPAEVSAALSAAPEMTSAASASLALAVQTVVGRETAMALVDRSNAAAHLEVWRTVLRRVPDPLLPAVGCLAAFCAWLDGRGVLAWHAIDRVRAVTPDHPLADAIAALLDAAINPRTWPSRASDAGGQGPIPPAA